MVWRVGLAVRTTASQHQLLGPRPRHPVTSPTDMTEECKIIWILTEDQRRLSHCRSENPLSGNCRYAGRESRWPDETTKTRKECHSTWNTSVVRCTEPVCNRFSRIRHNNVWLGSSECLPKPCNGAKIGQWIQSASLQIDVLHVRRNF